MPPKRTDRRHASTGSDQRAAYQRDRDRILYSSAFKRLSGVTQVVAPTEGTIFHNRLIHSLKVAQLGRRLSEFLLTKADSEAITEAWGGLDPEVVETAALAHDLGHPPFGHISEHALRDLVETGAKLCPPDDDGFEGNAQSFRWVVRLSAHREDAYSGLNLTRASLNALLKYPWQRATKAEATAKQRKKFGAYRSDALDYDFAREGWSDDRQSLEAAIMDFADGLAYSVHDLEDFIRAGLIPFARLISDEGWEAFVKDWARDLPAESPLLGSLKDDDILAVLHDLAVGLDLGEEYQGTFAQRARLRKRTSSLISQFLLDVRIAEPGATAPLLIDPLVETQMKFLQRIVWYYVIENPRLATQQTGQRRVIENLFKAFFRASAPSATGGAKNRNILPAGIQHELDSILEIDDLVTQQRARLRLAADAVCSYTDREALLMHNRLRGVATGSVMDLLAQ